MKNAVIVFVVLAVIGAGAYFFIGNKPPSLSQDQPVINTDTTVEDAPIILQGGSDSAEVREVGRYQIYTPQSFDEAANTRRVLFFYANWCPTCRPVDENFTNNMSKIPADVTVIRVNYNDIETNDSEKELAEQYEITYQHTFVQIDGQGNEVTKWNGGGIDQLLQNIE